MTTKTETLKQALDASNAEALEEAVDEATARLAAIDADQRRAEAALQEALSLAAGGNPPPLRALRERLGALPGERVEAELAKLAAEIAQLDHDLEGARTEQRAAKAVTREKLAARQAAGKAHNEAYHASSRLRTRTESIADRRRSKMRRRDELVMQLVSADRVLSAAGKRG